MIFVRSVLNRHSLRARLVFDLADTDRLVVSPIVHEILGLLNRPEQARRVSTFPRRDGATVLTILRGAAFVPSDETTP